MFAAVGPRTTPGTRNQDCVRWLTLNTSHFHLRSCVNDQINNKSAVQRFKNTPTSICMDRDKGAINMLYLTSLIQTMQKRSWETTEELSCTR